MSDEICVMAMGYAVGLTAGRLGVMDDVAPETAATAIAAWPAGAAALRALPADVALRGIEVALATARHDMGRHGPPLDRPDRTRWAAGHLLASSSIVEAAAAAAAAGRDLLGYEAGVAATAAILRDLAGDHAIDPAVMAGAAASLARWARPMPPAWDVPAAAAADEDDLPALQEWLADALCAAGAPLGAAMLIVALAAPLAAPVIVWGHVPADARAAARSGRVVARAMVASWARGDAERIAIADAIADAISAWPAMARALAQWAQGAGSWRARLVACVALHIAALGASRPMLRLHSQALAQWLGIEDGAPAPIH